MFKTAYGPRERVGFATTGPSRTHQGSKEETDINRIMLRWQKTGVMTHLNRYEGRYGDFTGVQDYQTSMNQVLEADAMFMSLPARVRARFGNDPAAFLDFASDERNAEELIRLGLATRSEPDLIDPANGQSSPPKAAKKAPSKAPPPEEADAD